jgi:hypothetical protein
MTMTTLVLVITFMCVWRFIYQDVDDQTDKLVTAINGFSELMNTNMKYVNCGGKNQGTIGDGYAYITSTNYWN